MSSQTTAIIIHQPEPRYFRNLIGDWKIRPVFPHKDARFPSRYDLTYKGAKQRSIRALVIRPPYLPSYMATPGLMQMVRQLCHLNATNAKPRRAIECAADAPNPAAYIAAHAW